MATTNPNDGLINYYNFGSTPTANTTTNPMTTQSAASLSLGEVPAVSQPANINSGLINYYGFGSTPSSQSNTGTQSAASLSLGEVPAVDPGPNANDGLSNYFNFGSSSSTGTSSTGSSSSGSSQSPYVAPATTGLISIKPQSVSQRVADLTGDSALNQQARGIALKNMQTRGMVNSSIAEQAGQAAVLQQAESLANADAQYASSADQFNANWANDMAKLNTQFNLGMQELQATWAHDNATLQKTQEFTALQNKLAREQQTAMEELAQSNNTASTNQQNRLNALNAANELMISTQQYIADITANKDMDDASKTILINRQIDAAILATNGYSLIYGSDLTEILDFESLRPTAPVNTETSDPENTETFDDNFGWQSGT